MAPPHDARENAPRHGSSTCFPGAAFVLQYERFAEDPNVVLLGYAPAENPPGSYYL